MHIERLALGNILQLCKVRSFYIIHLDSISGINCIQLFVILLAVISILIYVNDMNVQ